MRINLLVLSYINDVKFWQNHTLKFINEAIENEDVFITLLLVRGNYRINFERLVEPKIELRLINLPIKAQSEILQAEDLLDAKNQTVILSSLEEILVEKTFDFIILDSILFLSFLDNFRALSEAKVIYRQFRYESEEYIHLAKSSKFSFLKFFSINKFVNKIKEYEQQLSKIDFLITSVPEFLNEELSVKYFIVPEQAKINPHNPGLPQTGFKLFFVGNLRLITIQHSILWFLNETWDKLIDQIPEIEFHIVGETEQWFIDLMQKRKNVFYYPNILDFNSFIEDKTILLLPYNQPVGIMPEYLQAIATGKIIIANSEALCCWGLTAMIHFMPAKESVKFIEVLKHIYDKPEIRQYFSEQIINFANQNFDKAYLTKVVLRLLFRLLTQN